jgi:hypothetical protein
MNESQEIIKKKRGRPPKISTLNAEISIPDNVTIAPEKKRRGRPPKISAVSPPLVTSIETKTEEIEDPLSIISTVKDITIIAAPPEKKRRGRPPINRDIKTETETPKKRREISSIDKDIKSKIDSDDVLNTGDKKTKIKFDKPKLKEYQSQAPSLYGFKNFNTLSAYTWVMHNSVLYKLAVDLNRNGSNNSNEKIEKIMNAACELIPENYNDRNIFINSFTNEIDWEAILLRCKDVVQI